MIANNIDHLIEILEGIIENEKEAQSPLGYFPALYLRVTKEVRDKIRANYFDDNDRMERLDVAFANRYLVAYDSYKKTNALTESWQLAFEASLNSNVLVLQHLLLGMNAHINLDLGISTAQIMNGEDIKDIKSDFNKINDILANMVEDVQSNLAEIWPFMRTIDRLGRALDEALAGFSMNIARSGAWRVAKKAAKLKSPEEDIKYIGKLDSKVYKFGCKLYRPGFILRCLIKLTKWTEKGRVSERIDVLFGK